MIMFHQRNWPGRSNRLKEEIPTNNGHLIFTVSLWMSWVFVCLLRQDILFPVINNKKSVTLLQWLNSIIQLQYTMYENVVGDELHLLLHCKNNSFINVSFVFNCNVVEYELHVFLHCKNNSFINMSSFIKNIFIFFQRSHIFSFWKK